LDKVKLELETINAEFTIKMQKIRLTELELENKLQAQNAVVEGEREKMLELQKKEKASARVLQKKQERIDELVKDVEQEKLSKQQKVVEMREEYELMRQRVIKLSADLEYNEAKALQQSRLK
jgi:hypothetical protein